MDLAVFYQYVGRFKTTRDSEFSHTSIAPGGKYYIPVPEEELFYRRYTQALMMGAQLSFTEKHKAVGPVLIDLDFRFPVPADVDRNAVMDGSVHLPRHYTESHIEQIVQVYLAKLREFVAMEAEESWEIYVMEKPKPYLPKVDSPTYKDGLHIMLPGVVTRPAVQWMIREEVLAAMTPVFEAIGSVNSPEDILDEAVIYKNNWQMYGSQKPGCDAYHTTIVYEADAEGSLTRTPFEHPSLVFTPFEGEDEPLAERTAERSAERTAERTAEGEVESAVEALDALALEPPVPEKTRKTKAQRDRERDEANHPKRQLKEFCALVSHLSIRNKCRESPLTPARKDAVRQYQAQRDEEATRRRAAQAVMMRSRHGAEARQECNDLEIVRELVGILRPSRAERYDEWIRLGWCLHTVDYRLLEVWDAFSKHSPKYEEGVCAQKWDYMRPDGLTMGTLHMWARQDNPTEYTRIISQDLNTLMVKSLSKTDYDIAMVIQRMFQHRFRCSSIRNQTWYEFKKHRWHISDSGYALREAISEEVSREYNRKAMELLAIANQTEDSEEMEEMRKRVQKYLDISGKMKNTSFKKRMVSECADKLFDARFEEKLDSNPHLMCFENGVYDFQLQEFREGRPDDNISFCTMINYVELDPHDEHIPEILDFFSKVLTNPEVKEFVLLFLASSLNGSVREEKFDIWTGVGSNGKSKMCELFEKCIGDYGCKFNVSMLTSQKRIASNDTNSELVRAKGKRFAVCQEPGEDERINIGIMKELTGGDVIIARALFKESIQFKPMFKLLLCCNKLPSIDAEDGGTWRRIRCVEFTSRFCMNPEKENEFMIDMDLNMKFDAWKETFMGILVQYYKRYASEGMLAPVAVTKTTDQYQRANDHMAEFMDLRMVKVPNEFVYVRSLYTEFKRWLKEEAGGGASSKIRRRDFDKHIMDRYPNDVKSSGTNMQLNGYQLRACLQEDQIQEFVTNTMQEEEKFSPEELETGA